MAEYIERDAAIAVIEERARLRNHAHDTISYKYLKLAKWDIADIPAADVRPVVRGEWEWEMYQYTPHCSICGGAGFPGPANGKRYHFCPNCGADMRPPEEAE